VDDRSVEILKYVLLSKLNGKDDDREVVVLYHGREGDRLVFYVHGAKEGEVGVTRLRLDAYDKIASDIEAKAREEPFRDFCDPPYVSVRKIS